MAAFGYARGENWHRQIQGPFCQRDSKCGFMNNSGNEKKQTGLKLVLSINFSIGKLQPFSQCTRIGSVSSNFHLTITDSDYLGSKHSEKHKFLHIYIYIYIWWVWMRGLLASGLCLNRLFFFPDFHMGQSIACILINSEPNYSSNYSYATAWNFAILAHTPHTPHPPPHPHPHPHPTPHTPHTPHPPSVHVKCWQSAITRCVCDCVLCIFSKRIPILNTDKYTPKFSRKQLAIKMFLMVAVGKTLHKSLWIGSPCIA